MEVGLIVQTVLLSVIILVGVGMLLQRQGLVRREDVPVLNNLIVNLAMPSLVFLSMQKAEVSIGLLKIPVLANLVTGIGMAVAFGLSRLLRLDRASAGVFILASGFGNTSFVGFPLIISVFGQENLVYGVFYDQFCSGMTGLSLGAAIAATYGTETTATRTGWKDFLRFPPLWGLILGMLARGVVLPPALLKSLEHLSQLVVPLVMLSLGLSLRPETLGRSLRLVLLACGIKLVLSPLVLVAATRFIPLSPIAFQVSLVEAAMPSMMMTLSLAIKYRLNVELVAEIILVSLLLSTVTAPLFLSLFS